MVHSSCPPASSSSDVIHMLVSLTPAINPHPTASVVAGLLSVASLTEVHKAMYKAANGNAAVLAGDQVVATAGWSYSKNIMNLPAAYILKNPNVLQEIMELPAFTNIGTAAEPNWVMNGSKVFSSVEDFYAAYAVLVAVAAGALDLFDPTKIGKLENGRGGVISNVDLFSLARYFKCEGAAAGTAPTAAEIKTSVSTFPAMTRALTTTLATATAASPSQGALERDAVALFFALALDPSPEAAYSAGIPALQILASGNIAYTGLKRAYEESAAEMYAIIGDTTGGTLAVDARAAVTTAQGANAAIALVAAVVATGLTSTLTGIVSSAALIAAQPKSHMFLAFQIMKRMGYTPEELLDQVDGIYSDIIADAETVDDFDKVFDGYLSSGTLVERLKNFDKTGNPVTPSSLMLKGTDKPSDIAVAIANGLGVDFIPETILVATVGSGYSIPSKDDLKFLTVLKFVYEELTGNNSKSSLKLGSAAYTWDDFVSDRPDILARLLKAFYIDGETGTIATRGVPAPFNSFSGLLLNTTNTGMVIKQLVGMDLNKELSILIATETAAATTPSQDLAVAFVESLASLLSARGASISNLFSINRSPAAFNNATPLVIALRGIHTNHRMASRIVDYFKSSNEAKANIKNTFANLTDAEKAPVVSHFLPYVNSIDVLEILGTSPSDKVKSVYLGMVADDNVASARAYRKLLSKLPFDVIARQFLSGGVTGLDTDYPVLAQFESEVEGEEVAAAAPANVAEVWFTGFNDLDGIRFLRSVGVDAYILLSHTKAVKSYNSKTKTLDQNNSVTSTKFIFPIDLVKIAYDFDDEGLEEALTRAGYAIVV